MRKTKHILWLVLAALPLLAIGCSVDVNEGTVGDDDDGGDPECPASQLATVRFFHAAGGTPVTRPDEFTPPTTRLLQVVRPDVEETVTSLVAGRASIIQLCGSKQLTLDAQLAGADAARVTLMITLTPDADSSKLDVGTTIILAGIADTLVDGAPENPDSVADPLRFIVVPDTFGTGPETQIQVVHASRKTPALVDVEANPDSAGPEILGLGRYTASPVVATRGTPDTAAATVPVVFLEAGMTRSTHTIAPRLPVGAKALAIHFDTQVFDPDNPDPTARNPTRTARLFVTGDDPLLGRVAGGGIQF